MSDCLVDTIIADLVAAKARPAPTSWSGRLALIILALPTVRGVAVIGSRLAQASGRRVPVCGALVKAVTHFLTGADIDYRASIGPGLRLLHPTGIVIAGTAVIGANCNISQGVTIGSHPDGHVTLGDGVFIGPGAAIISAASIASGVTIGANAVVTKSFEQPGVTIVGVPARVIGS